MANISTPSLFDPPPPRIPVDAPHEPASTKEENRIEKLARDFVRWCFGFGSDFRNSPDSSNLRFWARKMKLPIHENEEMPIVSEARRLYQKRVEHLIKQSAGTPSGIESN
jgi:hypothetical protein